jgi:hypothetical protein
MKIQLCRASLDGRASARLRGHGGALGHKRLGRQLALLLARRQLLVQHGLAGAALRLQPLA